MCFRILAYNGGLLEWFAQIIQREMPWEVCLNDAINMRRSEFNFEPLRYNPVETCGYTPQSR